MNILKGKAYEPYRQLLMMWMIIYALPVLERVGSLRRYEHIFSVKIDLIRLPIFCFYIAVVIVAHYYLLYDRYATKRKYSTYLSLLVVYIITAIAADICLMGILDRMLYPEVKPDWYWALQIAALRVCIADIPLAYVYAVVRQLYKAKHNQKLLEEEQHRNELLLLRGRIEPDMISRTLDTLHIIAGREQAPKTATYMKELRLLFRYSTEEADKELIPIDRELDFIDKYVSLQRIRIADDKQVEIDVMNTSDNGCGQIAPMILLPFIENAFKYGVSYERQSRIGIAIDVAKGVLNLKVENTYLSDRNIANSTGTGLTNVIKRLDLQYKDKYTLKQDKENGTYSVSLRLELTK